MKIPPDATYLQDDNLARIFRLPNGNVRSYGKRVSADCLLTLPERREYVRLNGGAVSMCKFLMEARSISLSEAWRLVKLARGFDQLSQHRFSLAEQGYRVEGYTNRS